MNNQEAIKDFPGEYRLDVEDFGPIAKASVDLRPLTVFIGPSNTGKSYLAILLYALHQCFGEDNIAPYGRRSSYRDELLRSILSPLIDTDNKAKSMLEEFRDWLSLQMNIRSQFKLPVDIDSNAVALTEKNEHESGKLSALPKDIDLYIRSIFGRVDGFDRYSEREIGRCFGVDNMSLLVRRLSSNPGAKVKLLIPRNIETGMANYDLTLYEDGIKFAGMISGDLSLSSEIDIGDLDDAAVYLDGFSRRNSDYDSLGFSLARMSENIFKSLLGPLHRNAYYLPADRTGVMHSHQVVVSTLVQSATTAGLHPSASIPILSGVLADFLSQLIEMSGGRSPSRSKARRGSPRRTDQLAKRLEHEVLKGAVRLKRAESGYPSFEYRPKGWKQNLPLMRASSMVSELAPVVLYLRHLVRPGDVLVIEEPESHLHPAMQVAFTRQLAALVRAGIRVIVTTHSEWLLQELANLVRASQLPEGERVGIAGGEVALDPSQVGAWLFKPDEDEEGSTVSEVGLDESGLYPSDFEDVAVAMHNEWAEISSRLGEDG